MTDDNVVPFGTGDSQEPPLFLTLSYQDNVDALNLLLLTTFDDGGRGRAWSGDGTVIDELIEHVDQKGVIKSLVHYCSQEILQLMATREEPDARQAWARELAENIAHNAYLAALQR